MNDTSLAHSRPGIVPRMVWIVVLAALAAGCAAERGTASSTASESVFGSISTGRGGADSGGGSCR